MSGELADAVNTALRRTKEPIAVTLPLLWDLHRSSPRFQQENREASSDVDRWHGVPLFTFDKHSLVGKAACRMLLRECPLVHDTVLDFVPQGQAQHVVEIAAFYADAALVNNRLSWRLYNSLEELGRETDFLKIGCPLDGIDEISSVVQRSIQQLNDCRRHLLDRAFG